jgi:hypothetical protein
METRVSLKAREIYTLDEVPLRFTRHITVHIPFDLPMDKKQAMQTVVNRHQGNTRLHLCIQMPKGEKVFVETGSTSSVRPSNRLVQELERIIGEECVYVEPVTAACLTPPPERRWSGKNRS